MKNVFLRRKNILISVILILCLILSTLSFAQQDINDNENRVKNVILMIPDGMTIAHITLARWYQDGKPLAMDELACGLVRTYSANNPITDSAPAATAYATGYKTQNRYLSIYPEIVSMPGVGQVEEKDFYKPIITILEAAKNLGKSTGLVFTCQFPHATPAAFASHTDNRNDYESIAEQMVYNHVDVVLGGGYKYIDKNQRKDKEDLAGYLKQNGIFVTTNWHDAKNFLGKKIWGLFAQDAMQYDFDRNGTGEPSLAEMTQKALQILSKNRNGFFLMVEGSQIDWASHANDPVGVVSEVLAFDKAVKVALDFAKSRDDTAVIIAPDHTNGGMTLGIGTTSIDSILLNHFLRYIREATRTAAVAEKILGNNRTDENIKKVVSQYYGIDNLTQDEINAIKNAPQGRLNYVLGPIISKRSYIGWTSNEHTGEEVVLYAYHPKDYIPRGVIENTEVCDYMAEILGIDLGSFNENAYISNIDLEEKGYDVSIDTSNPSNIQLVINKGSKTYIIPQNKNVVLEGYNQYKLKYVSVYIPSAKRFFVSSEIESLIK
ncbi:alkaline phosphatase [Caldicellulosiruptor bescii]|uniref:Alkaline phosphatase n=2 Tax=Caldicellulosiruptor bescii TaxID=31899 RepID=B9MQE9_CALBD|nr:alkaline phosphatase [Caldicellulosiruptor bescii]ACM61806.1 Alkaline phosphatase [Caldicellulosiruptor bescii DSM 6725]PBC88395.1 alkaline phosphatase [Caldicellulosiruptor bescii]PBC92124.1 alkaline phosphatase [Caldicellulosiruptor bescii]PBD05066.1 alkaline phosphatase [Caldicellulosiruptor bescii]PBD05303.1 alkaline phosphatase [Caldicellulosiruptor bescii]